jgi:hypothetical protein
LIYRNSVTRFFESARSDVAQWLGVTDTTRASGFLIALGLVAAIAVLLCVAPVWRLYALVPASSLLSDRLRISHALATHWREEAPDVLLLGGSQVREIVPDDAFVSARLSAVCGRSIRFFNAASSAQLLETSWSIADHFAQRPPALLVIGTNFWRETRDPADAGELGRSLFPLPAPRTMGDAAGALRLSPVARSKTRLGILAADGLTALGLGSAYSAPTGDAFQAPQHQYRNSGWTAERKVIDARFQILAAREIPAAVFDGNVAAYRAFAAARAAEGSRTTFLLTPYSPEADPILHEWEPRISAAVDSLERAGTVLDLRASDLLSEDLYDTVHLVSSGRHKLWPRVEAALAARLPGCGG